MFFKIIGIYVTCVGIHNFINNPDVPKKLRRLSKQINDIKNGKMEEDKNKPEEVKLRSAHIVRNRIGF